MAAHDSIGSEQVELYRENGYLVTRGLFSDQEVEELRRAVEEAFAAPAVHAFDATRGRTFYSTVLNQRMNVWRDHEVVRRHVMSPRLARVAAALVGERPVRLFADMVAIKEGGESSKPTPWHRDFSYWPLRENTAVSAWIALDDVDESNGCMQFLAGSHRLPAKLVFSEKPDNPLEEYQRLPQVMQLRRGDATWHHGNLLHYAFPNRTDRPRRALVAIFFPGSATYDGKRHPITSSAGMKMGDTFPDQLFPVLSGE